MEPQHHHARGVTELGVAKPATVREVETAFRARLFDAWYAEGMAQRVAGFHRSSEKLSLGDQAIASRRIEHLQRRPLDSFWDADQVFYGHVLGFKGLERRAVVLVVNEKSALERSRERLYVGLSRARDQLVVCGDPDFIREVGGPDLARRLNLPST